jgi:hypothetical protein
MAGFEVTPEGRTEHKHSATKSTLAFLAIFHTALG